MLLRIGSSSLLPAVCLALGAIAMPGCGSPQKPVTFVTTANPESGVDVVSRTLSADGHATTGVDRKAGVVHTEWKDTGFLYGQVQQASASIVRRFTVVLAPAGEGSTVTVRMDARRCAQGNFTISNGELSGACEELTLLPEHMQSEVDDLGAKVRQALGQPASRAAESPPAR